jgi:hypothetical protein
MTRLLPIAALALLAGSAARAQTYDISNVTLRDHSRELQYFADSAPVVGQSTPAKVNTDTLPETLPVQFSGSLDHKSVPTVVHPAPEFHAAGALAALTLLLCGVAVLKGWRRE